MTLHLDQPLEQNKQAKEGRFSGVEGWGGRRRQLGSPTIHAMAAFRKRPQGTKSIQLLASDQREQDGADNEITQPKEQQEHLVGRCLVCACVCVAMNTGMSPEVLSGGWSSETALYLGERTKMIEPP